MKIMTPVEIAWIAGIIEGEGCIYISPNAYPRITVAMTDLDVLEQLKEFTGMGTICVKASERKNRKKCWTWRVNKHEDVVRLLLAIYPLMRERRRQKISEAIDFISKRLTWEICKNNNCQIKFLKRHYKQMFCTKMCGSRFTAEKSKIKFGLFGPGTRERRRERDNELSKSRTL